MATDTVTTNDNPNTTDDQQQSTVGKNAAKNAKKREKAKAKKSANSNNKDDDLDAILADIKLNDKTTTDTKSNSTTNGNTEHNHNNNNYTGTFEYRPKQPLVTDPDPVDPFPIFINWKLIHDDNQLQPIYNSNNAKLVANKQQTYPPRIPVSQLYENNIYPAGQIMTHPNEYNTHRITSAELRERDKIRVEEYNTIREAAEVHRQTRQAFMKWVKPGMSMIDIAQYVERSTASLLPSKGIERGFGFPTGVSLNHVAAHYTPNYKDKTVLQHDDVMKVDFGTQINGRIIDCAFTVAFNDKYEPLLKAVKEATEEGIKQAGIDVRLCDIGESIQEVMESYEITLNGKTYPIKSIRNLNGHSINPYNIHGGKSVPIVKNSDTTKMEEGEYYAIETFGSMYKFIIVYLW